MVIVAIASVTMPVSIAASPVVDRHNDAGRHEEQAGDGEDEQTDETCVVEAHESSPGRNRGCFSFKGLPEAQGTLLDLRPRA